MRFAGDARPAGCFTRSFRHYPPLASFKWQAEAWSFPTVFNVGTSTPQRWNAKGQRVWK